MPDMLVEVDLVRAISMRCFVARRVGIPAVFLVDLACAPRGFRADKLPVRVNLQLGEFDWHRRAFPAAEAV